MNVNALLITLSPGVVYALVAVVIGLESIGIPLPGEVILVAAALLASGHALAISPVWVAIAASAGAIIGDSIGYLAGRQWGDRIFTMLGHRFPRQAGPDQLAYAKHVFTRFGAWAVFFGRFVALLRIFAGPLAGALRMRYPRFVAANALGGLIWACGTTTVIYGLGARAGTWLNGSSWVALALAFAVGIAIFTGLRQRLEHALARHGAELKTHLDQLEEVD